MNEMTYPLPPPEALERAVGDYLHISRNKNNPNMYDRSYSYWPAEEMAWQKLREAIEVLEKLKQQPKKTFKESLDSDRPKMIDLLL